MLDINGLLEALKTRVEQFPDPKREMVIRKHREPPRATRNHRQRHRGVP